MEPQYLTRLESGAVRGHMRKALAAAQMTRQALYPAAVGGRVDIEEALARVREAQKEFTHLLAWLSSIKKGSSDGTDLTAHL